MRIGRSKSWLPDPEKKVLDGDCSIAKIAIFGFGPGPLLRFHEIPTFLDALFWMATRQPPSKTALREEALHFLRYRRRVEGKQTEGRCAPSQV